MNIPDLLSELLGFFGPPRADRDRSMVGESPMEEETSRFWQRLGFMLMLAAAVAALYVWVLRPHLISSFSAELIWHETRTLSWSDSLTEIKVST